MDTATTTPTAPASTGAPSITPAVFSGANIRETVIPDLTARANTALSNRDGTPQTGDQNTNDGKSGTEGAGGNNQNSFGDLFNSYSDTIDNSPDTKKELELLDSLRTSRDAATNAHIDAIHSAYANRYQTQNDINRSTGETVKNALLRTGGLRYSPISSSGILSSAESAGVQKLATLHNQEEQALLGVEQAKNNGDYQLLAKQLDIYDKARTAKFDFAKTLASNMTKTTSTMQNQHYQGQRDSQIADMVSNGTTDPNELLTELNKNGGDFTLKEINNALKTLSPSDDTTKLSGAVRDFYILKGRGELPASVTALADNDQLFGYLHQLKGAEKVTSPSKTPSNKKITYTEAKSMGLPVSVVGSSEADIVDSLKSDTAPHWFVEKLISEQGNDNYAATKWTEYKKAINSGTAGKKTASAASSSSSSSSDTSLY